jgi:hypothetical protein
MTKPMRGPNSIRSLSQNIQYRDEAPSRTAYLEDQPYTQAIEQLLPQIAAESEQAAKPVRQVFHYYRKKLTGRRCSCFSVETSPDGMCQICFGSGRVGGWDMHGCRTEVVDVTHPNLRLVNCQADYDLGIRPTPFTLIDGSKTGFIETEVPIVRNIQRVQLIQEYVGMKRKGSTYCTYLRAPGETTYTQLTDQSLKQRLGESKLFFRIVLTRQNTGLPSPRYSHLFLRYQLIPDVRMYGDMNLAEESFELGEMGYTDQFTTLSLYIARNFDYIRNEDFMVRQFDQKRFKVTRYERNCVSEILLSHRVMARLLIPGSDSLIRFP